jgi:hypothetical protein
LILEIVSQLQIDRARPLLDRDRVGVEWPRLAVKRPTNVLMLRQAGDALGPDNCPGGIAQGHVVETAFE